MLKPHPPTAGHPLQQRWEEVQRLREAAGMDDDDEKDEPGKGNGECAGGPVCQQYLEESVAGTYGFPRRVPPYAA